MSEAPELGAIRAAMEPQIPAKAAAAGIVAATLASPGPTTPRPPCDSDEVSTR